MHTQLKEPYRRGNSDRRHGDYRIRIRFSTISRCSLQSGLSPAQQSLAAYSRQVKGYGGQVRNWKSRPIDPGKVGVGSRVLDRLLVVFGG